MRLKRYLNKEIILASSAVLLILLLIFSSQQFVRFLGEAVDGKISPDILFFMVGLQIPPLLGFLLPLAFFLGILLAFGQLYVENELVVARSVGIGDKALARMVFPLALALAFIALLFSLWIAPWAGQKQLSLLKEQDSQSELQFLTPGKFQSTSDGKGIMYLESSQEKGQLDRLFIAGLPDENDPFWRVISANGGEYWQDENKQSFLVLKHGFNYQLPQSTANWSITNFDNYFMRIPIASDEGRKQKLKSISTSELLVELSPEHWAEFHWRLSVPISIPLLALLAIPLSRVQPRQGKFARMLPAILIYMSYMIFILLSRGAIEDGKIPGAIGLWWIHGLFAAYVAWQYRHPHRKLKKQLRRKAA